MLNLFYSTARQVVQVTHLAPIIRDLAAAVRIL